MDRPGLPGLNARAVATLAAALLAPAAVAVLRLFPPLSLSDPGSPSWLGPTVAGLASSAVGVAAALAVAAGLRRSTLAPLVEAAGLGSLAAGLAAGIFHAVSNPASFPDGGLPIAALVAGTGLLVSRLVPEVRLDRRARRMTLVGVAVVIEVALAVALFAPVGPAVGPWLTAAGAAMAAAACVPWPYLGPALLAGAFAALAAIRPGSLDAIPPLLAMLAGGIACSWERVVADRAAPVQPMALEAPALTTSLGPMQPSTRSRSTDDEAMRLAHELRGTIEELMQSRRTIELQREELLRTASHDPLTGVATRRLVLERLAIEVAESRRYAHPVAAVLIDVDGFARLNHEHGLAVGDDVLRELALRLRLRMRAADALGRVGGDSFLAILPHTDERGAAVFSDAIRSRLVARPIMTAAGELTVAISIGVAFMRPGMELSPDELLAAADEALASARAAGGNRIAFDRMHGLMRIDERQSFEGPSSSDGSETG
ncbi:MAG TPA: GGDEF domain-containing protein [Candidatus Limnocylindria bacterium]|nr:GGDEF domain-containing protein [Candidatus Limnocylindria bacterium]